MPNKLRVGAVSYLNTKPLVWGLEKQADFIDLYFDVPSKLSQMFEEGLLDVALLPVVSYFRREKYRIIPDISISTKGTVKSVNLFLKKEVNSIKEVALDTSSRTSRLLTVIILRELYGLNPDFVDLDNELDIDQSDSDAVLLIGDNAMNIKNEKYKVMDLGDEWYRLTNLPFVFAFWVTKCDTKLHGFDKVLQMAKENGIKAIDEIAEIEARRLTLSKEECIDYLSKSILYDLRENEVKGLEKFYNYVLEMGLIEQENNVGKTINTKQEKGKNFIKFYNEFEC